MFNAILYFSLVLLIEYGMVQKFWHLVSKMWIKFEDETIEEDEDILAEKEAVKAYQTTRGLLLLLNRVRQNTRAVCIVSGRAFGSSSIKIWGLESPLKIFS